MLRTIIVCVVALAGCARVTVAPQDQGDEERARVLRKIEPTVRHVPDPDRELLWRSAQDYMEKAFPALDITDPEKRVLETRTLEWDHERFSHRTRITVQLHDDPGSPNHTQLRLVAQKIEARILFEQARTGEPIPKVWILEGNDPEIERVVADQILRRYLLLRQGRNPDEVPVGDAPPGIRRAAERPAASDGK